MQSDHNYMPLFSNQSIILAISQTLLYKIHVSVNFNKIRKRFIKKPSFHLRLKMFIPSRIKELTILLSFGYRTH